MRDRGRARDRHVAEERQPDRQRQHRKPLECPALPRLCLRERRARRAFGEVLVESLAVLARETAVALLRERELRALTRDEVLDLLGERPARAEKQGLESAEVVSPSSSAISAYDRPSSSRMTRASRCARRDPLERADELVELDVLLAGPVVRHVVDELDHRRAIGRLAPALPDEVVRDREQPVGRLAWRLAALERSQRVHEGRLRDVLGVRVVAQDGVRVAVDVSDVLPVEVVQRGHCARAGFGCSHGLAHDGEIPALWHPPYRVFTCEFASSGLRSHLSG